jgi:hypothetical protein
MQREAQILREPAYYRIEVAGQLERSHFNSRYKHEMLGGFCYHQISARNRFQPVFLHAR